MKICRNRAASVAITVSIFVMLVRSSAAICQGALVQGDTLRSPNYPNDYPPNQECIWLITLQENQKVVLKFQFIEIEYYANCEYDYVEVRDGHESTSPLLGRFCGSSKPSDVRSTFNKMWVKFRSDGGTAKKGFLAEFYKEDRFNITTTTTTTPAPLTTAIPPEESARERLTLWFLRRKRGNGWGYELPRIATALFLGQRELSFPPDRPVTHEMGLELSNQLLARLDSKGRSVSTAELAGFVHALLVTCVDPRDFYGRNLVSELQGRGGSKPPIAVLALCNAGVALGPEDVQAVREVYEAKKRPFWTDSRALSLLALTCLSSRGLLDERILRELGQELKKRQFRNGTVDNTRTTALTLQALFATHNWEGDFDVGAAMKTLVQAQRKDGSIGSLLDSYYALPALAGTSIANISDAHCNRPEKTERETLDGLRGRVSGTVIRVTHSVWIGSDMDVGRTWKFRVANHTSAYSLIETVRTLDSRLNVQYSVSEGKPYVSSVFGIDDDPEKGVFWFTYLRHDDASKQPPTRLNQSPVDVILEENQELILWYKTAEWVDASDPSHRTQEGDTNNGTTLDI